MSPSDLVSVRLFKQHVAAKIPDYRDVEDAKVLQTLINFADYNQQGGIQFLINEFQNSEVDFLEILEDFMSDLVDDYFHHQKSLDPVVLKLRSTNNFSFESKFSALKELEIAVQRAERARLKEILRINNAKQDEEDLTIALTRFERKNLKQKLKDSDISTAQPAALLHRISLIKSGMWWKIAAIFLFILIPAGILLFNNSVNTFTPIVAKSDNKTKDIRDQYYAVEDISRLIKIDLPKETISVIISAVTSDQPIFGYAHETEEIEIHVISNKEQLDYLTRKLEYIEDTLSYFHKKLEDEPNGKNSNTGVGSQLDALEKGVRQLERADSICRANKYSILKKDQTYDFRDKKVSIYSVNIAKTALLSVYLRENKEKYGENSSEYYLKIKDSFFRILKEKSGNLIKVTNEEILNELQNY